MAAPAHRTVLGPIAASTCNALTVGISKSSPLFTVFNSFARFKSPQMRKRRGRNFPGQNPSALANMPVMTGPISELPPNALLAVTKDMAAISQLRCAICVWFFGVGDPISIHTLVVAAHDCYHALSHYRGTRSPWKTWFKSQSRYVQDQVSYAEEFFKHGQKDLLGKAYSDRLDTDMRILDSIRCHEYVFKEVPPLLRCWLLRFTYEHPHDLGLSEVFPERFRVLIKNSPDISRSEFYEKIHPVLCQEGGVTPPPN